MNKNSILRWLRGRRVAVLKGGWSAERPISMKTGAAVEQSFKRLRVPAVGIDVKPDVGLRLSRKKVNFGFIALHGEFGEDGGVQSLLDSMKIPFTGSDTLASALAMNKNLSKEIFVKKGVPTAPWMIVNKSFFNSNPARCLKDAAGFLSEGPLFIKPVDQGSAIGVSRIDKLSQIVPAIRACFKVSEEALIERFVAGRELTVGILGKKALPVVEIVPEHRFYDFHSKYAKGGSKHIVPAPLSREATRRAQRIALKAFQALDCSVYGRVDLIMTAQGRMSVLEVNTIPGMTATSLLPDAARASGLSFDDLVLKIVYFSLQKYK